MLRKQLEQQTLQTRQALAQLMLVREQLISETNARVEAQVSTPWHGPTIDDDDCGDLLNQQWSHSQSERGATFKLLDLL